MNLKEMHSKLEEAQDIVDAVNTALHGNNIVDSPVGDLYIAFDEAYHYIDDKCDKEA